jgi:hypothetical protein
MPPENAACTRSPQGGEPERRRDERRTRRQAGVPEKQPQGRCCRTRFPAARVAEPGAAEKVARHVGPESNRRAPGTAPVGPDRNASPLRPFSRTTGPENHVLCGARGVAQRWDVPLLENVLLPPRTRAGTFSRVAILGKRVTEKRATATKQAVETPEGGHHRSSEATDPGHRRAASRSGGEAERDRRPMFRRTSPETATDPEPPRTLPAHRPHRQLIAPTDKSHSAGLQQSASHLFMNS